VWSLAARNSPEEIGIILIDVEKGGLRWRAFEHLPHLAHPVITEEDEARRVMAALVAEMEERRAEGRTSPRLFVFVDEMQSLMDAKAEGFVEPIVRITRIGREWGIHFVGAVQNPTAENIGHNDIKKNASARLVGRVDNAGAAYVATGQKDSGAEHLAGAGDFLLVQPGQPIQRLTAALLTDKDIERLPAGRPVQRLPLIEQVEDPDHVLNVTDAGKADPLEPDHVAVALATGRGITWLARELGIGSSKAGRVKEFADLIRSRWLDEGYTTIPVIPEGGNGAI
jgi:DNA segregation ATPase FtsK/SpoIIIE-like protein